MKQLINFTALLLITVYVFFSCKKDNKETTVNQPPPPPPRVNNTPIAKAGSDTSIILITCTDKGVASLNGGLSFDPDNDPIYFNWKKISGPEGFVIRNSGKVNAFAEIANIGNYSVELTVNDAGGLNSKDTFLISVTRQPAKEYDIDVTFNATYKFMNNEKDCYYSDCIYFDITIIEGVQIIQPLGEFRLYFHEYTDTANSSYAIKSDVSIYRHNASIYGICDVNLKKLYQQGGGPFTGTIKVEGGSATVCNPDVFKNLSPLAITGNVDITTGKANVRIKGKTYF